jgi:hypothetical protein
VHTYLSNANACFVIYLMEIVDFESFFSPVPGLVISFLLLRD